MKSWAKGSFLSLAVLIALCIVLIAILASLFRGTPAWYGRHRLSAVDQARLARAAENQLIDAQNWAQEVVAGATRRARHHAKDPASSQPADERSSHQITLTQSELNALIDKWSTLYGWRDKYAAYVQDPQVVLHDGRLILAGRVKQAGAIVSFHFVPSVDSVGPLHLKLAHVKAGRLPLPDALWARWRQPVLDALRRRLPQWRAQARIGPTGNANFSAMAVVLSRLVFDIAAHRPADPILFFPLAGEADWVPVRVTNAKIEDEKLTLEVEPLTADERAALLDRIKSDNLSESPSGAQASGR